MSHSKRIAGNAVILFTSNIMRHILSFVLVVLIARYLGDEGLGQYSFAFAFVSLFIVFIDLGLETFMIREVARDESKVRKYTNNILTIRLFAGVIVVLAATIIAKLSNLSNQMVFLIFLGSISLFLIQILYVFCVAFISLQKTAFDALFKLVERIAVFLIVIWVLFSGYGILGLFFGIMAGSFISVIFSFIITSIKLGLIKFQYEKEFWIYLLKKSFPFLATNIFLVIYFRIDTVMLGFITDYAVVGWYNAAYKLIDGLSFIPIVGLLAVYPAMSKFFKENKEYLKITFERTFKYMMMLAIPISIGTTFLAARLIEFVYKIEFAQSSLALQILIWAELFVFLNYVIGYLLNSINKQKLFAIVSGIAVVINIMLNFLLIPTLSLYGAAIATVITQLINFFMLYYFASKHGFKLNLFKMSYKMIIAGIIMAVLIYYIINLHILIIIPIAGAVYFIILLITKSIGKEEFDVVKQFFHKSP
ncbi:MAG: flippase [Candidatus Woesearchaeota archaeon]